MSGEIGNLEINSDEIMSAISILDQSLSILQSDIKPVVINDFEALRETNLFNEGLKKIVKQVESLTNSNQNMMTKIAVHTEEFIELEQQLSTEASSYENWYSSGNGGNSGNYSEIADIIVDTVQQGTSINTSDIIGAIPKLDEANQTSLINFLNINKESDVSLSDLLFDASKSGILLALLKKFYGDVNSNGDVTITDDSKIAQKELLKLLNQNDTISSSLYKDTVLVAKDYLTDIAKENNISFEILVIDEKYNSLLMSTVRDLYDGNINSKYRIDSSTVELVRTTVDNIAKENNLSAEAFLHDNKYAPLLKGLSL